MRELRYSQEKYNLVNYKNLASDWLKLVNL